MSDSNRFSRRHFLRGSFLNSLKNETVKLQGSEAIRPPWVDIAKFAEHCTACGECIAVCETQIIVAGEQGYPEIRFTGGRKECVFCKKCVDVCGEDIFRPTDEPAWFHRIEIESHCLAYQRVECRSCEDNCPERAIRFQRQHGGIAVPLLNLQQCNGCGACLTACPNNAIAIKQNEKCSG